MIGFVLGVAAGCAFCFAGLVLFAGFRGEKLRAVLHEQQARAAEETQVVARAAVMKAQASIELHAMKRLVAAVEQSTRTGLPVCVAFAGHEEVVWVKPAPASVKSDLRAAN